MGFGLGASGLLDRFSRYGEGWEKQSIAVCLVLMGARVIVFVSRTALGGEKARVDVDGTVEVSKMSDAREDVGKVTGSNPQSLPPGPN